MVWCISFLGNKLSSVFSSSSLLLYFNILLLSNLIVLSLFHILTPFSFQERHVTKFFDSFSYYCFSASKWYFQTSLVLLEFIELESQLSKIVQDKVWTMLQFEANQMAQQQKLGRIHSFLEMTMHAEVNVNFVPWRSCFMLFACV